LAIVADVGNPDSVLEMGELETAARAFGLDVITPEIRRAKDIVPAFEALKGHAQALYVVASPLINTNLARIHTLAMGARLPAIYNARTSSKPEV
jgi:putative tryptophan/tyrosine transport system substrate-binding protein